MENPRENLDGVGPGCSFWLGFVSFILLALWQLAEALGCGLCTHVPARHPLFQPLRRRIERDGGAADAPAPKTLFGFMRLLFLISAERNSRYNYQTMGKTLDLAGYRATVLLMRMLLLRERMVSWGGSTCRPVE